MARTLSAYWPGGSRSAGKLKRPLSSVATLMVMVEPTFLALTTTPSIRPSLADDTVPDRPAAGFSASAKPAIGACMSAAANKVVAIREKCFAGMVGLLRFVAALALMLNRAAPP